MKFLSYSLLWFALAIGPVLIGQETKPAQQKPAEDPALVFTFQGGTLEDFIGRVKSHFGFDLREHATIDVNIRRFKVPKMKVYYQNAEEAKSDWHRVVETYNALSRRTGEKLGQWIVQVSGNQIAAIIFVAPPGADAGQVGVRAFQLSDLDSAAQENLMQAISGAADQLRGVIEKGFLAGNEKDVRGDVSLHQQTQIMVATGGPAYIELVQTLVSAFKERAAIEQAEKDRVRP